MKFAPHYSGKQQMVTYDTVKDHITQACQKTMRFGIDIAKAIRAMEHNEHPGGETPKRKTVEVSSKDEKSKMGSLALQITQDGHDIEFKEDLRKHNTRKDIYEENKSKACA